MLFRRCITPRVFPGRTRPNQLDFVSKLSHAAVHSDGEFDGWTAYFDMFLHLGCGAHRYRHASIGATCARAVRLGPDHSRRVCAGPFETVGSVCRGTGWTNQSDSERRTATHAVS